MASHDASAGGRGSPPPPPSLHRDDTDHPTPPLLSRPSGRPAPQPTGRPRARPPAPGPGDYDPRFAGPILGGDVAIPTKREIRRSQKRRRSAGERVLRGLIVAVASSRGGGRRATATSATSGARSPRHRAVRAWPRPRRPLQHPADRLGQPPGRDGGRGAAVRHRQDLAGARSDTLKIIHVDPATGTASSLSIPRDTFVTLTGLPANSRLSTQNKINAAFVGGRTPPSRPSRTRSGSRSPTTSSSTSSGWRTPSTPSAASPWTSRSRRGTRTARPGPATTTPD